MVVGPVGVPGALGAEPAAGTVTVICSATSLCTYGSCVSVSPVKQASTRHTSLYSYVPAAFPVNDTELVFHSESTVHVPPLTRSCSS